MSDTSLSTPIRRGDWLAFGYYDAFPVGGIAVALLLGTSALLALPVDGPLLVLAFSGTGLVYLADRGLGLSPEDRINRPRRLAWVQRHRSWLLVEAVIYVVGIVSVLPLLHWVTILLAGCLGSLGALHSGLLFGGLQRAKASGALKPAIIAGAWAIGAVVLPTVEAGREISLSVIAVTGYRFALILPNVILVDWIDREGDEALGSGSWIHNWSGRTARLVASLILCIGLVAAGVVVLSGYAIPLLLLDAVGGGLLLLGIWTLRPAEMPSHMFLLDAIVAWPVVTWITSMALH